MPLTSHAVGADILRATQSGHLGTSLANPSRSSDVPSAIALSQTTTRAYHGTLIRPAREPASDLQLTVALDTRRRAAGADQQVHAVASCRHSTGGRRRRSSDRCARTYSTSNRRALTSPLTNQQWQASRETIDLCASIPCRFRSTPTARIAVAAHASSSITNRRAVTQW